MSPVPSFARWRHSCDAAMLMAGRGGKGCLCTYKYLVRPPSTVLLSIFSSSQQPPPGSPTMSFFAHRINPSFTVVLFQYTTGDPEMGFFVKRDQSGSLETGTQQRMVHWPYTGPYSAPMDICRELTEGNRNTQKGPYLPCLGRRDASPLCIMRGGHGPLRHTTEQVSQCLLQLHIEGQRGIMRMAHAIRPRFGRRVRLSSPGKGCGEGRGGLRHLPSDTHEEG
jgi:hypothetical protein